MVGELDADLRRTLVQLHAHTGPGFERHQYRALEEVMHMPASTRLRADTGQATDPPATSPPDAYEGELITERSQWILGLSVAVPLAALLGWVLWDAFGDDELGPDLVQRTDVVGDAIFSQYLIPFEALSLLLLAALIGAVVLARRD